MMHSLKMGTKIRKMHIKDFLQYVGGPVSCHNKARTPCEDFQNRMATIRHKIEAYSVDAEREYETRVIASLDVASFLIAQAHAFHGHDESSSSLNKG